MATTQAVLSQCLPAASPVASSSGNSQKKAATSNLNRLSLTGSSFHGSALAAVPAQGRVVSRQSNAGVRAAVSVQPPVPKQKKSQYDIETYTTWLLKQEQAGSIDAELTIVLSSISLACKQIASLVQRAGISNMTGLQGASNVQGEDQKKLDVISNEVNFSLFLLGGEEAWKILQ